MPSHLAAAGVRLLIYSSCVNTRLQSCKLPIGCRQMLPYTPIRKGRINRPFTITSTSASPIQSVCGRVNALPDFLKDAVLPGHYPDQYEGLLSQSR